MSKCCQPSPDRKIKSDKHDCPGCERTGFNVSLKTLLMHIKEPWLHECGEQTYFFCNDSECEIVYFSEKGNVFNVADVRTPVGIKEQSDDTWVCYCFGVSKAEARKNKKAKAFIVRQTKESLCACETVNPSGRCCLKNFPKA